MIDAHRGVECITEYQKLSHTQPQCVFLTGRQNSPGQASQPSTHTRRGAGGGRGVELKHMCVRGRGALALVQTPLLPVTSPHKHMEPLSQRHGGKCI